MVGILVQLALIIFIACISLLVIFRQIYFFPNFDKNDVKFKIVIFVKNAQNQIEGIINTYYKLETKPDDLCIVDCGSNDQTPQILERFSRRFPGLWLFFFRNRSYKDCMQQTLLYLDEPVILFLDATKLKSKDIHILTKIFTFQEKCLNRSKNL